MEGWAKYPKKLVSPAHFILAIALFAISYFFVKEIILVIALRLFAMYLLRKFTLAFFTEIHVPHHMEGYKWTLSGFLYSAWLLLIIALYCFCMMLVFKGFFVFDYWQSEIGLNALAAGLIIGALDGFLGIFGKALTINLVRKGETLINLSL